MRYSLVTPITLALTLILFNPRDNGYAQSMHHLCQDIKKLSAPNMGSDSFFLKICLQDLETEEAVVGVPIKIQEWQKGVFLLVGHTDSTGCMVYNFKYDQYSALDEFHELKLIAHGFTHNYEHYYSYKEVFMNVSGMDSLETTIVCERQF